MADETKIKAETAAPIAAASRRGRCSRLPRRPPETGQGQAAPRRVRAKARAASPQVAKPPRPCKTKAAAPRRRRQPAPPAEGRRGRRQRKDPTMNFDPNKLFASFDALPGATPFQALFADAGERSQEVVAQVAEGRRGARRARPRPMSKRWPRPAASPPRAPARSARTSSPAAVTASSRLADAIRSLAEAKSPTEFLQLQSELARASFDRMVAETLEADRVARQARRRSVPAAVEPRQRQRRAHQQLVA